MVKHYLTPGGGGAFFISFQNFLVSRIARCVVWKMALMRKLIFRQHYIKRYLAFSAVMFESKTSTFTYLLGCPKTREAILIDPVIEMVDRDLQIIHELRLKLMYAGNTHAHADHVTATAELRKLVPECKSFISHASGAKANITLVNGETIQFGCITYVCHKERFAMTGDTLLIRGCGRTDFQQGDSRKLYNSVHSQIFSLPDDYLLFPGFSVTSVEEEKKYNPRLTLPIDQFVEFMKNLKLDNPKQIDKAVPANMVDGDVRYMNEAVRAEMESTSPERCTTAASANASIHPWIFRAGNGTNGIFHETRIDQRASEKVEIECDNYLGSASQVEIGIILTALERLQWRFDTRCHALERRISYIERTLASIQKYEMDFKRQKCCDSAESGTEDLFSEQNLTSSSSNLFGSNVFSMLDNLHADDNLQCDNMFLSSCSAKTFSEFMKSSMSTSAKAVTGDCFTLPGGDVKVNVKNEEGYLFTYNFPGFLVEKMLKDNPPEPSGWAASKALVCLLDFVYHPLELAMRRLPSLPVSSKWTQVTGKLHGRQKCELFLGTQFEMGVEFESNRFLPCCKLIEHFYANWKYKAFERNHAFREMIHKKCRSRRRDLKQYLQVCGKPKEEALESIIKGIDLPVRDNADR
ncbi:Persulfide dioxygenase ETHE1, mitochondrial [Trichinella zimbabwensis]|uniref:Persulfide dioxygenase ETHE1, mitochondrial n=1 Tax=Trichinella zimbabwensis TaxID=268475 RepID=A0A0V1HUG0_9BILA|nr:Persulfide dioxygenase ETHE1, mitochondrial [Trichinella zimbabwensis]